MRYHRHLIVGVVTAVAAAGINVPGALGQEDSRFRPFPRKPVEIGQGSEIPTTAQKGESIVLKLRGIMLSSDVFDGVDTRALILETFPPQRIVKIDAYARSFPGAGITAPWSEDEDLKELNLEAGEWTLVFNEQFGNGAEFKRTLLVQSGVLPNGPVAFTDIAKGVFSAVRTPTSVVVDNQRDWDALWGRHRGPQLMFAPVEPAPVVDFSTEVVIARFMGTRNTGGYATTITHITSQGGDYTVTVSERSPGPDELVTQAITAPFHMVRAPKPTGTVKFDIRAEQPEPRLVPAEILASSDVPTEGKANSEVILGLDVRLGPADSFEKFDVRRVTRMGGTATGAPFTEEIIIVDALVSQNLGGAIPRTIGRKLDIGPLDEGLYTIRLNGALGGDSVRESQLVIRAGAADGEVPFETIAQGDRSFIRTERNVVVRDRDAWRDLWYEHLGPQPLADAAPARPGFLPGPAPLPEVNFDEEMVIARFMGTTASGKTDIEKIEKSGEDYTVSATDTLRPIPPNVRLAPTTAFHIVKAPKNAGDVDFDVTVVNENDRIPVAILESSSVPETASPDQRVILGLDVRLGLGLHFDDFEVKRLTRQGSTGRPPFVAPFTEEIISVNAYAVRDGGFSRPTAFGRKLDLGQLEAGVYTVRFNSEVPGAQFERKLVVEEDGDAFAVEIAEGSSVIPERIAEGEDLVMKLKGLFTIGDQIKEIRIRRIQLERLPPIDVIQVDAYATNPRAGIIGVTTGWEEEAKVGQLAAGSYELRFNTDFGGGSAFFSKKLVVTGGAREITGTVERRGDRVRIVQSFPAFGTSPRPIGRPVIEVLNVTDAPEEVLRYLRILDGKTVTVRATDGASSDSIAVSDLVSPKTELLEGTATARGRNATLRTRRGERLDVTGSIRDAIRHYDGEQVSVVGFRYGRELVGVSLDAKAGLGGALVRDFPFPFGGGERLDRGDIVSVEGSTNVPWFGRHFLVRYKDDAGNQVTGWVEASDLVPHTSVGFLRALSTAAEDDGE